MFDTALASVKILYIASLFIGVLYITSVYFESLHRVASVYKGYFLWFTPVINLILPVVVVANIWSSQGILVQKVVFLWKLQVSLGSCSVMKF